MKSGSAGTVITVFATRAARNRRTALANGKGCADNGATVLNSSVRTSDSRGFSASRSGVVGGAPNEHQICFYGLETEYHSAATHPAHCTVI